MYKFVAMCKQRESRLVDVVHVHVPCQATEHPALGSAANENRLSDTCRLRFHLVTQAPRAVPSPPCFARRQSLLEPKLHDSRLAALKSPSFVLRSHLVHTNSFTKAQLHFSCWGEEGPRGWALLRVSRLRASCLISATACRVDSRLI
ncbi:hypothetical protein V7S43_009096 [Phytophthora oleae]|uniref:Uncharacterized protein n=1 Tax=Phytophthora oleae TaxID=2107226 RepID=A0ABD3FFV9_9STRA